MLDVMYYDPEHGQRFLDVAVLAAQTQLGVAAQVRLTRYERKKHTRYPGPQLIPFVLDVRGLWGREARAWVQSIVKQLPSEERAAATKDVRWRVSKALQTAVAEQCLRSALPSRRDAAPGRDGALRLRATRPQLPTPAPAAAVTPGGGPAQPGGLSSRLAPSAASAAGPQLPTAATAPTAPPPALAVTPGGGPSLAGDPGRAALHGARSPAAAAPPPRDTSPAPPAPARAAVVTPGGGPSPGAGSGLAPPPGLQPPATAGPPTDSAAAAPAPLASPLASSPASAVPPGGGSGSADGLRLDALLGPPMPAMAGAPPDASGAVAPVGPASGALPDPMDCAGDSMELSQSL